MGMYNKKKIAKQIANIQTHSTFRTDGIQMGCSHKKLSELILVLLTKYRQSQITQYVVAELFI